MRRALMPSITICSLPLLAAAMAVPVAAQSVPVETRVDRLEKEMRAVQRKVFPGGAPVQPDISTTTTTTVGGSTTAVTDLTARVDAIETQLASLTGQVEQQGFKIKQLEDALAKLRGDDATATPPAAAPKPAPAVTAAAPSAPSAPKPAATAVDTATTPASPSTPKAATPAAPSKPAASAKDVAARKAAVAAIERPNTGNVGEDAYAYGYRLWNAKFYPEAQAQLKATVEKYGSTSVGSRAANLLGRAYLDDGKPALAASSFFDNYQKRPRGDRAAESLTYLGEALIQLGKLPGACKAYTELEQVYGTSLTAAQKAMMQKGRSRAKCAG